MGWETRRGGGRYYTRSRRRSGRVVREYVGAGLIGELAAAADAEARQAERQRRAVEAAERDQVATVAALTADLCRLVDAQAAAALMLAGYHQHHRGEWRQRRDRDRDRPDR